MNLFLSYYTNKLDKKGRISLPSSFRSVLPKENKNEIILFKSLKYKSIEGCSSQRISKIANRIDKLDIIKETNSVGIEVTKTRL